jgi:hypothetical protein
MFNNITNLTKDNLSVNMIGITSISVSDRFSSLQLTGSNLKFWFYPLYFKKIRHKYNLQPNDKCRIFMGNES